METKLDYSLKTAQERAEFVSHLPQDQLKNKKYLEYIADYIIMAMTPEEKKKKEILTSNRMITINKRETSYQGLVSKFENGEDGLYNLIIEDKNVLLTPKDKITEKDKAEIDALAPLEEAISRVEKMIATAAGKRKFLLKKQLIEMRQEQYIIKNNYKQKNLLLPGNNSGKNPLKGFSKIDLTEHIHIDENMEPVSDGLITFFNHNHVSALLCNYSALKQDCDGKFTSDAYYMMMDFDNLIDAALAAKYPLYYKLLIYKIDGKSNAEIQQLLEKEFNVWHSVEYLSCLWRKKIPKIIAEKAKEDYLMWYFTYQEKGKWKRCSKCGQIKLASNRFFSKNNTAKDGFYSMCKECRNHHGKEK